LRQFSKNTVSKTKPSNTELKIRFVFVNLEFGYSLQGFLGTLKVKKELVRCSSQFYKTSISSNALYKLKCAFNAQSAWVFYR